MITLHNTSLYYAERGLMRQPLYEEDHGYIHAGKAVIRIRGWLITGEGKRLEAKPRYVARYADVKAIKTARYEIARELGAM